MVRIFVYSMLAVILALAATWFLDLTTDPGYLLIAWRNYTFETSLFALVVLLIVVYALWRLLVLAFGWLNPFHLTSIGRRLRARRDSRSKTVEGLMHFARSNWQSAYNQLLLGSRDKDASVINFLAAAYAACEMQRRDLWLDSLDQALRHHPDAASTVNTVKAGLLLKTNQLDQCVAVLEQLRKTSLNDKHLLGMLRDVYVRLEDWDKLRELLPSLIKNQVVNPAEQEQIEKTLFVAELQQMTETIKRDIRSPEKSLNEFRKHWKKLPHRFHEDEKLVVHVVRLLLSAGAKSDAARIVESHLGRIWSKELIEMYGATDFGENPQQLVHGEIWLRERPRDAKLLLALGRICMRNRLWGRARDYFEASLRSEPSPDAYGELSRLTAALGDTGVSNKHFSRYIELTGKSLPLLPLPTSASRNE
ncbi:MAG: heme biosynthesis HemY N-terminal domain-containing protein [Pseudohongiellaceae bacterium]